MLIVTHTNGNFRITAALFSIFIYNALKKKDFFGVKFMDNVKKVMLRGLS